MTTYQKLLDATKVAMEMTQQRLKEFPKYGVYIHAADQLNDILKYLHGKIDLQSMPKIDIGIMAVKELETSDPEYADILCTVDYLYDIEISKHS